MHRGIESHDAYKPTLQACVLSGTFALLTEAKAACGELKPSALLEFLQGRMCLFVPASRRWKFRWAPAAARVSAAWAGLLSFSCHCVPRRKALVLLPRVPRVTVLHRSGGMTRMIRIRKLQTRCRIAGGFFRMHFNKYNVSTKTWKGSLEVALKALGKTRASRAT
jgi:hypothetical protein